MIGNQIQGHQDVEMQEEQKDIVNLDNVKREENEQLNQLQQSQSKRLTPEQRKQVAEAAKANAFSSGMM